MDDYELAEIQAAYGDSCTRYESKATDKLARSDTIIISGYGCSLSVKNDALRIYPGRTHKDQQQDTVMLYRGAHNIKQIILLSGKGEITLDAIQWSIDQGVAIMMIDGRGSLIQSLTPEHESYAVLRRAQYQSIDTGMSRRISHEIVYRKVVAQIEVLKAISEYKYKRTFKKYRSSRAWNEPSWYQLERELAELPQLESLNMIMMLEARCGLVYWDTFLGIPLLFDTKSAKKVPPHWRSITERVSYLSSNRTAQRANNPYHAVTNYAYAVLQGQCKQSLVAQGFDTACGFLHSDAIHRDSLVFDVMDAGLRPKVDQFVLNLFTTTTLTKGDFMSSKTGEVIFNPQFSRYIAATCKLHQQVIDDTVLWLKGLLLGF